MGGAERRAEEGGRGFLCCEAVDGGVPRAAIIDGRQQHSVLLEIFTEHGIGTEVVPA